MDLPTAIKGMMDARKQLATDAAINNPSLISQFTYVLGQYTADVEAHLGEVEKEYEIQWATIYSIAMKATSATAAKQQADVACAADKGNIKELTRLVGSSWKLHTGGMARINHLNNEHQSMRGQT